MSRDAAPELTMLDSGRIILSAIIAAETVQTQRVAAPSRVTDERASPCKSSQVPVIAQPSREPASAIVRTAQTLAADARVAVSTATVSGDTAPPASVADYIPRRYLLILLAFAAVAVNYSDRTNISVAVISMAAEFNWSNTDKGWVLSAFLIGYMLSMVPGGFLCSKFGGKRVMTWACCAWSLFTVLTPWAARSSYRVLILCRVLLGMAEGLCWPAVHQLIPQWFPTSELGRAVSFFTSGAYFGTVVTLLLSPPLIEAYEWPSVFYFFGLLGLGFVCAWHVCVADSPRAHSSISVAEIELIEENSAPSATVPAATVDAAIPWRLLFQSRQLWAFYLNMFASGWSFFVLLAWMPDYFKETLHVEFKDIGWFTFAPYLCQGACALASGAISQAMVARGAWSADQACGNMQLVGLLGPSLFLALLGYTPVTPTLAVFYLTAALSLNAFTCAGASVYHQLVAPRYSGVVYAIGNTFSIIPGVIGIISAGSILDATRSWSVIFLLGILCFLFGVGVWLWLARGRDEALDAHVRALTPDAPAAAVAAVAEAQCDASL